MIPRDGALASLSRTFSGDDVAAYAEATGDRNPIHLDEHFAAEHGLPGCIVHGLFVIGVAAGLVETAAQGYDLTSIATRFSSPLPVGASLDVSATVTTYDEQAGTATFACSATSARHERVLSHCSMTVRRSDRSGGS